MLGLAKRVRARFLLSSTSEVYGDPLQHPQTEEYWGNVNPIGERACYDEGKRVAETLSFDYYREHGIEIRVARIFNTYGPKMSLDDGRVVSNFLAQALRGEPMTIYGDGKQTRSFQYISDLVAGLVALMDGDHTGPINIGESLSLSLSLSHCLSPGNLLTTLFVPFVPREPRGVHDARARGDDQGGGDAAAARGRPGADHRVQGEHGGRPSKEEAGYNKGQDPARVGAQGRAQGRPGDDD